MENIITLITAITALITASIGAYQAFLLRRQMQDDARPYVVADVVPGLHGPGSWDLTLHSTGRSTARKIRITTDPELAASKGNPSDYIIEPLTQYLQQERSLAPDARHRIMWRYSHKGESSAGAPAKITATVTYEDDRRKKYKESFNFDTEALAKIAPVPREGPKKSGPEAGKELQNIDRAVRNLAVQVGELRR